MRRSGRVKWSELRVGMVLLFAFAVLLWASFTGTGFTVFERTEQLLAYFAEVNGLVPGAPVRMAGLEVGYVGDVFFVQKDGRPMVRVMFRVRRSNFVMISTDAMVAVGTMGLMGDKYLDVRLGRPGFPPVTPGAEITVARATDLTNAFAGAPDLVDRASEALGRLSELLDRVNRGEGFLGQLVTSSSASADLDSIVVAARELLTQVNTSQKELAATLQETSQKLSALADAAQSDHGSLGRLINDTALYVNLTSLTEHADRLFRRLEDGQGAAGKLLTEDKMYDEVRALLAEVQSLISDIKANPKKYFKVSVF